MSNEAKIVTGVGIAILFLFGGLVYVAQKQQGGLPPIAGDGTVSQEIIARPDSHATASTPTRVTVTEFGDYQCPACAAAHPIVLELIKKYEGKVSFVFRQYPLTTHQNSRPAARASEAAALQGKFLAMHGLLYEKQAEWAEAKNPEKIFTGYSQSLGLNIEQFTKDMAGKTAEERINRDIRDGTTARIQATPTFFINTKAFVGVPSKEFIDALEKELAG